MRRVVSWPQMAVVFAVLLVLGVPAFGQHVAGLKITETNYDPGTLTIDMDVTEYYDTTFGTGSGAPFSTAFLGVATGFGYQIAAAIDWGDGNTVPWAGYGTGSGIPLATTSTSIAGAPRNVYRGSFSHTYAADGDYTIIARSSNFGSVGGPGTTGSAGFDVFTGNYQFLLTPTFSSSFRYVTANAVPGAGGAVFDVAVPTVGEIGLMALALLLAGSALFLMRRA